MFSIANGTSRQIKRILLVRTDRLGDVILTLPMLPALRKCFPDAYIAMLLRRYTGEVFEGNPHVNELIWYDRDGQLIPFDEMCATLRSKQFDAAIVVYPRFRLAWLMFRSGIPLRIGTGYRYYSFLFNKKVYEHRKDAKRHEVEYNLSLLKELSCRVPEDFAPEFFVDIPREAEEKARRLLDSVGIADKPFVIVHPGSGGSAREWSPKNFGQLALRFRDEMYLKVIVTGGKGEEVKVSDVVNASNGKAIPLVGKLSIKEFGALVRSARLFVSNSTGPLHLAVAMGTPVVGLFPQHTAMSARRWGPYTEKNVVLVPDRPLDCNVCVENKTACECMATISAEQVFQSAASLLNRRKTHGAGVHAS
ncbi:MAG: glycosyltransferase family 9 protein [Bacteroidota bacterium]